MTAAGCYRRARQELAQAGVSDAQLEAGELVLKFFGVSRAELLLEDRETDREAERAFTGALRRRLAGEPLPYILGEWEFCGFRTLVRPGVLIPRGDSELLARAGAEEARRAGARRICDLCCGSGAVGLAAAKLSGAEAVLIDISERALALSRENAALYGVRAEVLRGDVTGELPIRERFPVVLCNPPYIAYSETVDPEVLRYEPPQALFAPEEGLFFYRRLVESAERFLFPGGMLLFEIGAAQGETVTALMRTRFDGVRLLRDYGGHDRVVLGRLRPASRRDERPSG